MIVLLIILATLATFASWMLISKPAIRVSLGIISLLALGGTIYLLTDHFVHHTGMKIVTTTTQKDLYSTGNTSAPYGFIVYKEIGTDSDNKVLVYRDAKDSADATAHFISNTKKISEAVKKTSGYELADVKKAYVETTTKRYEWKSDWAKWLYGIGGEEGELVSQKTTAYLPQKTWMALTEDQANQLQDVVGKMKVQAAQHPEQAQAMMALAKSNPQTYAEKQIAAIKAALNIAE